MSSVKYKTSHRRTQGQRFSWIVCADDGGMAESVSVRYKNFMEQISSK